MGAWGYKPFDNDDACDWLGDLQEGDDLTLLVETFAAADTDYLEAPEASCILAAAEVLLALLGRGRELPEDAQEWVVSHTELNAALLKPAALTALEMLLGENCELDELWSESDEHALWRADVQEMMDRLAAA